MKRLAGYTALVLATLLGAALLWEFRGVLLMFAFSLAIAAALRPLVDRQIERGWSRGLSILLVYGLSFGLFFAIGWSLGPTLLDELRRTADNFVLQYDRLYANWPAGTTFQQAVVAQLPPPSELYAAITGPRGEAMVQSVLGVTANVFQSASQMLVAIFLSLYWAIDQVRFERLWLTLLPAERRARAREIWRAVETGVGTYIRSELTQSLLAGVLLGLGYRLLNLEYPALLAAVSVLAWLVPWLGVALGLVPVILVGLAASPLMAILAAFYTLVVFIVLEFVVEPRLLNRRQYNSLLLALVVLTLGEEFGLVGVLIAPPLSVALQILGTHLLTPASTPAVKPLDEQFTVLAERLASVRALLTRTDNEPEPQVVSMVERLDALLEKASTAVRES
jgi:predicted PurR-regulated permease PerM